MIKTFIGISHKKILSKMYKVHVHDTNTVGKIQDGPCVC